MKLLSVIVVVPALKSPPPAPAVSSARVLPTTVSVPPVAMPPPTPPPTVLLEIAELLMVKMLKSSPMMPPPYEFGLDPPEIVTPDSVTTAPPATSSTWTALPPLIVSRFAPGPLITSGPEGSASSSVLDSVIVCGVPKTLGSKLMMLPARLGFASACSITYTRSPESPEPVPSALVRSTV